MSDPECDFPNCFEPYSEFNLTHKGGRGKSRPNSSHNHPFHNHVSIERELARLRTDNARLRAEIERLVAALIREHDEVAGYRELLKLPISPKETCPTCALVDEARRTIGGEGGA